MRQISLQCLSKISCTHSCSFAGCGCYPDSLVQPTFLSDLSCQLYVLWLNGDSFCMHGSQLVLFKQTNQIGFQCLVEGQNGCGLKSQIIFSLEGLSSNFSHQSTKMCFPIQQFGRPPKFAKFLGMQVVALHSVRDGGLWQVLSQCQPEVLLYFSTFVSIDHETTTPLRLLVALLLCVLLILVIYLIGLMLPVLLVLALFLIGLILPVLLIMVLLQIRSR
jgi:hypothetical protein